MAAAAPRPDPEGRTGGILYEFITDLGGAGAAGDAFLLLRYGIQFPTPCTKISCHKRGAFQNNREQQVRGRKYSKLTTDFATVKTSKKYIRMGEVDLQTSDDDAHASDIKSIMQLVQCFLIYAQILLHFRNPATQESLN